MSFSKLFSSIHNKKGDSITSMVTVPHTDYILCSKLCLSSSKTAEARLQ